jgi:hypothetical protein
VQSFLHELYFLASGLDGIPELTRLMPEERTRVIAAAQQAAFWDLSNDWRSLIGGFVVLFVVVPSAFYIGIWMDHRGLGQLAGLMVGLAFAVAMRIRTARLVRPHVMNILNSRTR